MTVVSEVKPVDSRKIPPRFDVRHAVAFFFHDELGRLVVDLERSGSLSVRLNLEPKERDQLAGLSGEALWNWLEETGRHEVIDDLTYRQLTAAVVADAAQFLCESLLACGKGKTAVAFALLRKPLKENLLLLEWLLAFPEDFLARFHGESTWDYTLNRLPLHERRRVLREAARRVDLPGIDDELLWVIRYAKEYPNSLETLWTQATHLVTSAKASATERGNLNFVFSSESAIEEQWEHYYRIVPLILYYFLKVAEGVAFRFVEPDPRLLPMKSLMRNLAFMRYAESMSPGEVGSFEPDGFWTDLGEIAFECEDCSNEVAIRAQNRDRVWVHGELKCEVCSRVYDVWRDVVGEATDANGV